jgi:hypothetical protein
MHATFRPVHRFAARRRSTQSLTPTFRPTPPTPASHQENSQISTEFPELIPEPEAEVFRRLAKCCVSPASQVSDAFWGRMGQNSGRRSYAIPAAPAQPRPRSRTVTGPQAQQRYHLGFFRSSAMVQAAFENHSDKIVSDIRKSRAESMRRRGSAFVACAVEKDIVPQ